MDIILTSLKLFLVGVYLFAPLLLTLAVIIAAIGQLVGRLESWSRYDALYWSFITATTVGYGDLRPTRRRCKALSVAIALFGLVFTGIVVAIAVHAATVALETHVETDDLSTRIEQTDRQ